jgi:hypothetical protein
MTLRVGSLVFATEQGLGILAKDFYDHGVITDVALVRHGRRPEHPEWYPGASYLNHRSLDEVRNFIIESGVDLMFFLETPFNWDIIPACRELGVKTALMPMYECEPDPLPAQPDYFINPSLLDYQYYRERGCYLPVPVNTLKIPWKLRREARVFIHNSGHGGLLGRNGTENVIKAFNHVKSPAHIIVRGQDFTSADVEMRRNAAGGILEVRAEVLPYEHLWCHGDVFLFPDRFNGLSLPLQEAFAAGLLVMATYRYPANDYLPNQPLIPGYEARLLKIAGHLNTIEETIVRPEDIAATVDYWYGKPIEKFSMRGKEWRETMSWEALKPRYLEVLNSLVKGEL